MSRAFVFSLSSALCYSLNGASQVPRVPVSSQAPSLSEQHKGAVELVDLMGARQRLTANLDKMIEAGVDASRKQDPTITQQFEEEWARRMKAQFSPDAYLNVMVKVWEAHFNADELKALVKAQKDKMQGNSLCSPTLFKQSLAPKTRPYRVRLWAAVRRSGQSLVATLACRSKRSTRTG